MSYKDLYQEILRTQQDIAVTYQRLVAVENELKRNISESVVLPPHLNAKLDDLQQKIDMVIKQLFVEEKPPQQEEEAEPTTVSVESVDEVDASV
ncbi:ORF062 [Spodoptera frugiperda granulovirus]|uniref:ORF062 n=1 Tax=Spodoptera frugiperda granulovirus TaxID=307454 RepID=A0A0C5AUV4_9BBAC|nr:ORF062 [Spodoptera frugiperda granulovirus]AJK91723.1 ORF062 [Spodoptera frugiperda granulovirus]